MAFTYLYSTRIKNSFDEDQAEIRAVIRSGLSQGQSLDVELINYYKGLPVSFTGHIAGMDKGSLDLDIDPVMAAAISHERYTFIRSPLFSRPVLAMVQYVSIKHRALSLRKFCYVEIMAERRRHIRLELEKPLNAAFNSPAGSVRGKLIELSVGGAVLTVAHPFEAVIRGETTLTAMIPDIEQGVDYNIKLPAVVIDTANDGGPGRVRFSIAADDRISDRIIAKFLYHRQVELIHELKEASELGMLKQAETPQTQQH